MKYSRYNDPAALLIELCLPFSETELETLAHIGAKMNKDPEFSRAYTLEIKKRYLENIHDINNNTYKLQHFETLNFEVCKRINSNAPSPKVLLPEYAQFHNKKTDKKRAAELREQMLIALGTRNPKE